ncbi:MAG: hypothetical protein ACKVOR_01285 [Flavobacteriales bacterium]
MRNKPLHILIISTWAYYEPLACSYLLPYIRVLRDVLPHGSHIHFITMEKARFSVHKQTVKEEKVKLAAEGIHWHTHQYVSFGLRAIAAYGWLIARLSLLVWKKKISVLHPFAPVAGAVALHIKKLTGKKLVLDSWEPHAESMVESGVWNRASLAFRFLFRAEKKLTLRANYLIAASSKMKNYVQEKWSVAPARVAYRPACVDLTLFDPARFDKETLRENFRLKNKIVAVCTGKLTGMYLGMETMTLLKAASHFFGEKFHALLITETEPELIEEWRSNVNLPSHQLTIMTVPFERVPQLLAMADFAINPQKPLPSKRYGTPIKDGEYWAMGLPVILPPDISEDSEIAVNEKIGVLWNPHESDHDLLFQQLTTLMSDGQLKQRCRQAAMTYRNFELAHKAYREVYNQWM